MRYAAPALWERAEDSIERIRSMNREYVYKDLVLMRLQASERIKHENEDRCKKSSINVR